MKNNILIVFYFLILNFNFFNIYAQEQFDFDVTEIEISDNGEKFVGKKRGTITSTNGVIIISDRFEYLKKLNILSASGDVRIIDTTNNNEIFTRNIIYEKNNNLILTKNGSRALDKDEDIEIKAENFSYDLSKNIITAEKNVIIENKIKNYKIFSNFMRYFKNEEKIITEGETLAEIHSKYNFDSRDVIFLVKPMELVSKEKTTITDKFNLYELEKFRYLINNEELIGENILINTKYNLPTSDKFYFKNAIVNLKNRTFYGTDTNIKVRKDIFENSDNDPRIVGVSAESKNDITVINKGVFTSCKQNENCTPWSIKAEEIVHDKERKEISYKNAILKIYDFPILYFPKFFHPDPTVNRRSGFLKPQINNSTALGNSFSIPYYSVLAKNKDLTFTPYIFENNMQMLQNEFRQVEKNSKIYANFGFVNNYNSSIDTKKNSIFNLFANYKLNLNLKKFTESNLFMSVERVTNDTFLKIFDTHIDNEILQPTNYNNLKNELKIILTNENYDFESGIISYENLQEINNDRYEYVLPYYRFNKILSDDMLGGKINFSSNADNLLNNTNVLKSSISNDLSFKSKDYIFFDGLKSFFEFDLRNLNSVGKNNSEYKSSPQIELMGIINFSGKYALLKQTEKNITYLTPKILLKVNPNDMKNHSLSDKTISVDNIFSRNRLGISDSFETGRSITLGVDYKIEDINDFNKFFEIKLASVIRDKEENFIPKKTTLNKKTSNIYGSLSNNFSEFFNINYKFSVDNNLDSIDYNDFSAELNLNNFNTKINFVEERAEMGSTNFIDNSASVNFKEKNYLTFKTRRNRKLNLTEYYDFVYQYKNDCLTAGIKYKKTFYEDRDLKPSENLFFTISLIPLTTYEQKIDR
tara:strand:- start:2459 stop:5071 length:2613 start_codon:yes stop_codon:yes gene_type:complete